MKRLLILLCCFAPLSLLLGQQSIEELKQELKKANSTKEKMYLNYELGNAYLRVDEEVSIDYSKKAFNQATDLNNPRLGAQAAYLVGRGYERDRNERNADVWYRTAQAKAKQAGDLDLIVKSVQRRGRLAEKERDYRDAYQIYEDAFNYFSQKGTSISDLESKFERQKAALAQERKRLQSEIDRLSQERDQLSSDRDRLQRQQQKLVQEKRRVEEEVSQKEERLADVSQAKERADSIAETKQKEVKQLSRQKLEQEAVLKAREAELAKATLEAERNRNRAEQNKAQRDRLLILAASGVLLTMLLLILFLVSRRSRRRLKDKNRIIQEEQERSNELLLNILPKPIADELKEYGKAKPRKYKDATVLFSDFKNFSKISEQLTPEELVEDLDKSFKAFDFIISQYEDIEKIKTIGDAYMCASGLSDRRNLPNNIIRAAIEMQQFLDEQKQEKIRLGKPYFEARIGIHTGPVVAGVVGVNKFAYDIWGDTVNIASRVESNGQEGRVNISEATYSLVKYNFECEYRGKVQAKNKGLIDMYFVKKERQGAAVTA
jgi:adenylate cyclase